MKRYTVDELYARQRPCEEYTQEQIEAIAGDGLTAREIAALDISIKDRIWVISALLNNHRALCRQVALDTSYTWCDLPQVVRDYLIADEENMRLGTGALSIPIGYCVPDAYCVIVYAVSAVRAYNRVCVADEQIAVEKALWEKYLQWAVEALEAEDQS